MKLQFAIVYLMSLFSSFAADPTGSWPPQNYKTIRAFLYNLEGNSSVPIIQDGKVSPTVVDPKGVVLDKSQAGQLIAAITGNHEEYPHMRCYMPRHAYVFYDAANKIVGWFEVCFECQNSRGSSKAAPVFVDLQSLKKLNQALKIPVFDKAADYRPFKK
jgi:hypothetical protein